ncbi:MAG: hypothetical protein PVSMB4_04700 [Ktedonobacterales bacterium]
MGAYPGPDAPGIRVGQGNGGAAGFTIHAWHDHLPHAGGERSRDDGRAIRIELPQLDMRVGIDEHVVSSVPAGPASTPRPAGPPVSPGEYSEHRRTLSILKCERAAAVALVIGFRLLSGNRGRRPVGVASGQRKLGGNHVGRLARA